MRMPHYDKVIDDLVKADFQRTREAGLPIDNIILRRYSVERLLVTSIINHRFFFETYVLP